MANIDLTQYGITGTTEVVYNPSYEMLFEEETKPGLEGYEKGQVSELGAVNVMTGIYTGRSPKDKFIVMDDRASCRISIFQGGQSGMGNGQIVGKSCHIIQHGGKKTGVIFRKFVKHPVDVFFFIADAGVIAEQGKDQYHDEKKGNVHKKNFLPEIFLQLLSFHKQAPFCSTCLY